MLDYNKGTKALLAGNYLKALQFFKRSKSDTKELYLNMGNTYRRLGQFAKAMECYLHATREDVLDFNSAGGLYSPALCNLGLLSYGSGNDLEAITFYKAALERNPLSYDSIWNCSTALLRQWCSGGKLNPDAWGMYDYRFKAVKPITNKFRHWDGSSGGTIIVLAEQGLGDKIQFGRYFPLLLEKFDNVILQLPKTLWGLFPSFTCTEGIDVDADYSVPMASLPSIYGARDDLASYIPRSAVSNSKLKVGIEWMGSPTHLNDAYRSCHPSHIVDLVKKFSSVEFYNFRPDSRKIPGVTKVVCSDFAATAAELGKMDLLISVDTSIVHLGGSMGLETWMMQPSRETDFRWGLAEAKREYGMEEESNIWYPSVAVIDNDLGWDNMFEKIASRLRVHQGNASL